MSHQIKIYSKPQFKSGDTVFVILNSPQSPKVEKTYIRSAICQIIGRHGEEFVSFSDWYDIGIITFSGNLSPSLIHAKFVFKTEKEAKKMVEWHPVTLTEKQWLLAVGNRDIADGPGNIDDGCDLLISETNDGTSELRTLLLLAKINKGIMELDKTGIQNWISICPNRPKALNDPKSNLSKLFKQLNLKWKK